MKRILISLAALVLAAGTTFAQTDEPVLSGSGLVGSQWTLVATEANRVQTPALVGDRPVTLDFVSETDVHGSGGCNTYNGAYTASDGLISFSPVMSTRMACVEEDRMAQENAYFAALALVERYVVSGNRLTLIGSDGTSLHFAARGAYSLLKSQWQLVSVEADGDETPVIGETPLTLEFQSAHEIAAFGGCNGMGSTYTADDETITIEPGAGTLIACDDDINAQEANYFGLLAAAVSYSITDDALILTTEDGSVLRFAPTGAYALWRTPWQLDSMTMQGDAAYVPVEGSLITLTFGSDGTMGGSAGCNQYGGRYILDANTLTFTEVVSTLMACVDDAVMAQESMYLNAIYGVTGYTLEDGQLTLVTPDGTLIFVPRGSAPVSADEA